MVTEIILRSLRLLCFSLLRITCIWIPDKQYFTLLESHSLVNSMFFILDESKKHLVVSTRIHWGGTCSSNSRSYRDSSSLRINLELCSCCFPLQGPEYSKANYSSFVNWFPPPSQKLSSVYMSCHPDKHRIYCFGDAEENLPSSQAEKQQHLGISCQWQRHCVSRHRWPGLKHRKIQSWSEQKGHKNQLLEFMLASGRRALTSLILAVLFHCHLPEF